jgi:hypothetical protein
MNVENILATADAIENGLPDVIFDIYTYGTVTDCGTAACIAGHAAILAGYEANVNAGVDIVDVAQKWLGLEYGEAISLFEPYTIRWDRITPKIAAEHLRNIALTGKVNWNSVLDPIEWIE